MITLTTSTGQDASPRPCRGQATPTPSLISQPLDLTHSAPSTKHSCPPPLTSLHSTWQQQISPDYSRQQQQVITTSPQPRHSNTQDGSIPTPDTQHHPYPQLKDKTHISRALYRKCTVSHPPPHPPPYPLHHQSQQRTPSLPLPFLSPLALPLGLTLSTVRFTPNQRQTPAKCQPQCLLSPDTDPVCSSQTTPCQALTSCGDPCQCCFDHPCEDEKFNQTLEALK